MAGLTKKIESAWKKQDLATLQQLARDLALRANALVQLVENQSQREQEVALRTAELRAYLSHPKLKSVVKSKMGKRALQKLQSALEDLKDLRLEKCADKLAALAADDDAPTVLKQLAKLARRAQAEYEALTKIATAVESTIKELL